MRIIPVPIGKGKKGKNKDILEVTIFGDFVQLGRVNCHINDIVKRNLPEDYKDPKELNYLNNYAIKAIIKSHHQNSLIFPNEQLSDWKYLETIQIDPYIVGLATKNRDVIEKILERDQYYGKLGLSGNPVATEFDLIRILKGWYVDETMRCSIAQHPNLTKEVIKAFANENCHFIIRILKSRKDIENLIDSDVRRHFQKCGSKLIRNYFNISEEVLPMFNSFAF